MKKKYARTPTVFQMEAAECGAASLAMILAYWGKRLPLEQLRIETGVSRDGCNAGNIMRAAKRLGMECRGYQKKTQSLKKLDFPCIIHWNYEHFTVLEGFRGRYACLNDPAVGRRRLTFEELSEGFTGIVITFKPTSDFVKENKTDGLLSMIKERLSGTHPSILRFILIGLLLAIPGLAIPEISRIFIDDILGKTDSAWFPQLMLILLLAAIMRIGLTLYRSHLLRRTRDRLVLLSARELLNRLFRLPINFLSSVTPEISPKG